MRRLALAGLAIGAVALLWGRMAWPGHAIVRGHAGDVGATMVVYAIASIFVRRRVVRAAIAAAVAVSLELAQRVHDGGGGVVGELAIGASFDPWDLVAYALGIAIAVAWDRRR